MISINSANSGLQICAFFSVFHCYLGLSYGQCSLILCYSLITINYHIIPPLLLIDPHSTYSPNNFGNFRVSQLRPFADSRVVSLVVQLS